jgi:phosphatidylglycerophosphate synthase
MEITKHDVLTAANAITLLGLILTLIGCFYLDSLVGLGLIVAGRALDLVDGPVARATQQTRFSVIWDPIADKLALLGIVIGVLAFQIAPWWIVLYIVLQNLTTTLLATRAYKQQQTKGALIPGKLNMFFQMSCVILFIASNLTPAGLSNNLLVLAYASFIISLPLAAWANYKYLHIGHKHP